MDYNLPISTQTEERRLGHRTVVINEDMAEVTWRATLIGALMLFLIGVVVATCLNYTQACLSSIKAGLNGPYSCQIERQLNETILCNDTGVPSVQDCIYVFVSFEYPETSTQAENIKLSYTYNKNDTFDGQTLGKVKDLTADYHLYSLRTVHTLKSAELHVLPF